jgi:hypothetical protein
LNTLSSRVAAVAVAVSITAAAVERVDSVLAQVYL